MMRGVTCFPCRCNCHHWSWRCLRSTATFMSPFKLFTATFILKRTLTEGTGSVYSLTKSYDPANDCYTRPSSGYIRRIHTGKTRHCYALSREGTMAHPRYCTILCGGIIRYCATIVKCKFPVDRRSCERGEYLDVDAVKPMTIRSSKLPVKDYRCSYNCAKSLSTYVVDPCWRLCHWMALNDVAAVASQKLLKIS